MKRRLSAVTSTRDDGAVLVLALLFVLVVALVIGAVVDQARVSIGNTVVVRNQQALTFAADTGIERAIQEVRRDSRKCAAGTDPTSMGTITANDRTVELTCELIEGQSSGVLGYAVITLDPDEGNITTQGGGQKRITGPVWAANLGASIPNLTLKNGDLAEGEGEGSCSQADPAPAGVTFEPAGLYGYSCTDGGPPAFKPTLPSEVPDLVEPDALPEDTDDDTCRTFLPGRYNPSNWPGFLDRNYFVSGVYYFEDLPLSVGGGDEIVAGWQNAPSMLGAEACSNDLADGVSAETDNDSGVKWLFGGSTTFTTQSSGASVELYPRRGGDESAEGTQGVTVMQVTAELAAAAAESGDTWNDSDLDFPDDILVLRSGANPSYASHGITYVPHARVNVDNASNVSQAQFRGGVVAGRLHLQNSGSSTGLAVSIDTDSSPRLVRVTATTRLDDGDKPITASAVLWIEDDATRTAHIQSWRSTN